MNAIAAVGAAVVLVSWMDGRLSAAEDPHPNVPPLAITVNGRDEHPTVYLTRADFQRAREHAAKYDWAKTAASALLKNADAWVARSDDDLRKMIPQPGACFAYGFSGCPVCGGKFAGWWGAAGVASLDDPWHVKCVNGHRLPDEAHPDKGDGWVDPTGKKFYFVGTYNSFVIDTLMTALDSLVLAYGYTGDAKYGEKAAVVLDELARIYPACDKGSWNYPADPTYGRFNRPMYQVARMLIRYANQYDILLMGDLLDRPSSVAGMTRRKNIENNMLLNGAKFCYEQAANNPALNNGEADYQRGQMVVAAAMGIPEYMKFAVDGPFGLRNMVEDNIDGDGQYYETSAGYSHHARYLYVDMAEILQRYRDAEHPEGYDIAEGTKFRAAYLLSRSRLDAGGFLASLGDDAPNVDVAPPARKTLAMELGEMEHLAALTGDPKMIDLLIARAGGDLDGARKATTPGDWLLFHAVDPEAGATTLAVTKSSAGQSGGGKSPAMVHPLTGADVNASDLLARRGLAILRDGRGGSGACAATLRAGPTLNHGHLDEMNLNIYAFGRDLTYDLGYGLGSTHTQVGWAHETASHNTVLVDETPQMQDGWSGGSIECFVTTPDMTIVRANDPACYTSQKVSQYDRTVMLVSIDDRDSYLVDIFRVSGGGKHDYMFHAQGTKLTTEGLKFGPPAKGSVAGESIAWGDKLGVDGDVKGIANKPYWNPPPGNGLGFMMSPKSADASDAAWSGTWEVAADAHLRINMLPASGVEVVAADAPGIYPSYPRAAYLMARRKGEDLRSTFAAVIEPYAKDRAVVEVAPLKGGSADAVGVKITLKNRRVDYVLQAEAETTWSDGETSIVLDRGAAKVSMIGGKISSATLVGGAKLDVGGVHVSTPVASVSGKIARVDREANVLYLDRALSAEIDLAGRFISVGGAGYSHRSSYRVASVSTEDGKTALHLAPTSFLLTRGHMDGPAKGDVLPNVVPLEYGKSVKRLPSGFFRGKVIESANAKSTISEIADQEARLITVKEPAGFKAGDDLLIYDVRPGDDVSAPSVTTYSAPK